MPRKKAPQTPPLPDVVPLVPPGLPAVTIPPPAVPVTVDRWRRLTLKEAIDMGPRFVPVTGICCVCAGYDEPSDGRGEQNVDLATDLGIRCWRVWRWASAGFPAPAPCWPDA